MDIEVIRGVISDFEMLLRGAFDFKCADLPVEVRKSLEKMSPVHRWDLQEFVDAFVKRGIYPTELLQRAIYDLIDIKLELYYILEIDLGLYNALVYARGYSQDNPRATPHLFLTRLSLDQSLISKSRILWERIMNFVYHLETGERLENKLSKKRSKRRTFFNFISGSERWKFLLPYDDLLDKYDSSFRTPEFHKSSILKWELIEDTVIDTDKLLALLNEAINIFWGNLLEVVSGRKPHTFSAVHLDSDGK